MGTKHSTARSFSFAFEGIQTAFLREPHFKFHTIAAVVVLVLAAILSFSPLEWLVLVFTIALVLILELINTSLEAIVNIVSPQIQNEAKVAKDVAASAVLIASFAAFLVGLILFGPKLLLFMPS
jgi:diacylglycerol kinase